MPNAPDPGGDRTPRPQACLDDAAEGSTIARVAYTAATDGATDWPQAMREIALDTYGLIAEQPSQFAGLTPTLNAAPTGC